MTADEARGLIDDLRKTQAKLREEMVQVLTQAGNSPTAAHERARELLGEVFRIETEIDQLKQHLPNWGSDEPE